MKKVVKRTLVLLVCLTLLLITCSCVTKEGGNSTVGSELNKENTGTDTKKVVTIRWMNYEHPNYPNDINTPVMQELMKKTNVKIEFESTSTDYDQKLNLVLAGGDLPDIVFVTADTAKLYGQKGLFMALNDFWDKSKNLKPLIPPELLIYQMGTDKNIYSIPLYSDEGLYKITLLGRKDWLNKMGLEMPETTDEFYNLLLTVKKDASKMLGKDNIIPLINRDGLPRLRTALAYSFDTREEWMIKDDKYIYTPITDEYKEMLMYTAKLYKDGLLDKEYATLSSIQWEEKVLSGSAFFTFDYAARSDTFTSGLIKQDPNASFAIINALKGPRGGAGFLISENTQTDYSLAISAKSKYAQECFDMIDYIYGPEGALLFNYGIEGQTYDLKDNKPVIRKEVIDDINSAPSLMDGAAKYGIASESLPYHMISDSRFQLGFYGAQMKEGLPRVMKYSVTVLPSLTYTKEQSEQFKNLVSIIDPIREEYENKFVMGLIDFDQWDQYIGEMKAAGVEDYVKIQNEAYTSFREMLQSIKK